MTLNPTVHPNNIALHTGKQRARSVESGTLAPIFKKNQLKCPNPTYLDAKTLLT